MEPCTDLAEVADGLHDVAGAGFAFGANHGGAFADAAQEPRPGRAQPQTNGTREAMLVEDGGTLHRPESRLRIHQ